MQNWADELGHKFNEKTKPFGKPLPPIGDLQTKYLEWRTKCREKEAKLEDLKKQQKSMPWWNELETQKQELAGLQEQNKVLKRKADIVKGAGNQKNKKEQSLKNLDKSTK
jgi:hypothetical protein